jgi:hypothetical protein
MAAFLLAIFRHKKVVISAKVHPQIDAQALANLGDRYAFSLQTKIQGWEILMKEVIEMQSQSASAIIDAGQLEGSKYLFLMFGCSGFIENPGVMQFSLGQKDEQGYGELAQQIQHQCKE